LRELEFLKERYPQDWQTPLGDLLLEILKAVKTAKATQASSLSPTQVSEFERRYDILIEQGLQANPPQNAHLTSPRNAAGSNKARRGTCWSAFEITNKLCWLLCMILRCHSTRIMIHTASPLYTQNILLASVN
jgi:hypothetical protein